MILGKSIKIDINTSLFNSVKNTSLRLTSKHVNFNVRKLIWDSTRVKLSISYSGIINGIR